MRSVSKRNTEVFRLATRITACEVGIAKQPGRGVSEHLFSEVFLPIAALTYGKIPAFALVTLATDDRKWNNDTLALPEVTVHPRSDFDDLAHHFVAHHIARHHRGNVVVE